MARCNNILHQAKTERSFDLDSENTILMLKRYCIDLKLMQKSRKRQRYAIPCHANRIHPNIEIQITRQPIPASPAMYIHPHIMFSPTQTIPMQCTPLISLCPNPTSPILIEFVKAIMITKGNKETPTKCLQTRINLLNNILSSPSRPFATSLRDSRRQLNLLNLIRVRDRVDVQAAGHVPGYVAVESCHLSCQY